MAQIYLYLVSAAVFLVVDAVWLNTVMRPLFERHVGDLLRESIRLEAAVAFYLCYIVGILYFATWPALKAGSLPLAVMNAAFLGFLAYGTYEATNMTTLKGWTWSMVLIDTGWGMALTALTAAVGYWAAPMLGLRPA